MKQQLINIKESIHSIIGKGEILLIIPPFGSIYDSALGPHILQTLAREKGYETDLLYLNMPLASLIGLEQYEEIHNAPQFWMIGERLFARSAYGLPPLGKQPGACPDEPLAISGCKTNPKIRYKTRHRFDLGVYLRIEQICNAFLDEVISVITDFNYKIIGCANSMMGQTNCCVAILNGIKKYSPGTVTIMGGGRCKDEMAEGIASLSKDIDYTFSGESEKTFLNFLADYSTGKLPLQRIIPGEPPDHLDTLPLGDYEIFFKQYAHFIGTVNRERIRIWHETGRGCWWAERSKCTFCCEHPVSHRQKSIKKVVREIKSIKDKIGDKVLYMSDSIMPRSYHRELLPVLDKKEEFPPLTYQLRTTVDLQGLVNIKNAKILAVLPGIETFSSHLLKLMNKGVTAGQNLLFLRNATSVGVSASWFLLWGFPGGTLADYEEVLQLLPLIRHLQPPLDFRPIRFARFSPYLSNQKKYDITNVKPWAVFDSVYPEWADGEKLAPYYSCEYPSELSKNPGIISEMGRQVSIWTKTWKSTNLVMRPFLDAFAIYDNRDIHKKAKTHVVDYEQAKEIMTGHVYDDSENLSENLKWAAAEKLGAVVDSRYIPLVTASPGLLLTFENK